MKPSCKVILTLITLFLINSCVTTDKSQQNLKISIQGGINHGGITENTDLSIVPNAQPTPEAHIDAYSGATHIGANGGLHINKPLKYGEFECGIDYMYNSQTFSYADQGNKYAGSRDLSIHQLMIPLTYNFILLKKTLPNTELQLKIGYNGQLNFVFCKGYGLLPVYSINHWSNGAVIGISAYPIRFPDNSKLGFYADVYRGNQIYIDYYNQEKFEMPGSSFMKAGIRYRFK